MPTKPIYNAALAALERILTDPDTKPELQIRAITLALKYPPPPDPPEPDEKQIAHEKAIEECTEFIRQEELRVIRNRTHPWIDLSYNGIRKRYPDILEEERKIAREVAREMAQAELSATPEPGSPAAAGELPPRNPDPGPRNPTHSTPDPPNPPSAPRQPYPSPPPAHEDTPCAPPSPS